MSFHLKEGCTVFLISLIQEPAHIFSPKCQALKGKKSAKVSWTAVSEYSSLSSHHWLGCPQFTRKISLCKFMFKRQITHIQFSFHYKDLLIYHKSDSVHLHAMFAAYTRNSLCLITPIHIYYSVFLLMQDSGSLIFISHPEDAVCFSTSSLLYFHILGVTYATNHIWFRQPFVFSDTYIMLLSRRTSQIVYVC